MTIVGYDVPVIKKDKERTWYDSSRNILYSRELPTGYKYCVEAVKYQPDVDDYERYLVLSRTKCDEQARRIEFDSYARYKFRPIIHKDYLNSVYETDSFSLILVEHTKEYDVYIIN